MAKQTQQRFYQLPSGMWIDAMTGQQAPDLLYLKEAMISNASPKAQAQAAKVERENPEQYEAWLYDETNLKLPKPSDYSTALNVVNEFGSILERPLDRLGVPKFTGRGVLEELSPTSYFGRGIQESRKGNAVGGIVNSVLAGASLFSGPLAGKIVPFVSKVPFINQFPKVTRAVSSVISQAPETIVANLLSGQPTSSSVASKPSYTMTADQMARRAAMEKNRTDIQGRSGMGATSVLPGPATEQRPSGGYPGVPAVSTALPEAKPAPLPALSPPSPEQIGQYGEEMSAINRLYKQTLADIAQEQEQGQLGYARVGQAAQRQAAGSAVDIGSQLAASGMGSSPASAFGAEQMVQTPLVQQRQANRLNLDQLLANLQKQKTQAGTAMDMSKVGLNRWLAMQRAANTASQVGSGYQNSLGGM